MNQTGVRSTGSRRAARTSAARPSRQRSPSAAYTRAPWSRSHRSGESRCSRRSRAGRRTTARVVLENGGAATWRSRGEHGLQLSYHWLDRHGNAIVWDSERTPFPRPVAPGEVVALDVPLDAPRPPGRYVLRFDLVEEHAFWLSEVGVATHDLDVDVAPLIAERRLAVVVHGGPDSATDAALAAQAEPLVEDAPAATAHRRGRGPGARLVAPPPRRARGGLGGGGAGDRARRSLGAAAPPATIAPGPRGKEPTARRPAAPPVAPRRPRAGRSRRPAGSRGRRAVRGRGGRQASDAIRSSTALKTTAPSASATTAATQR